MSVLTVIPEGARIAIDTSPFIYYIEGSSKYNRAVVDDFEECAATGRNTATTSVITLAEVLTGAIRNHRKDLEAEYASILTDTFNLEIVSIDVALSESAARLRYTYGLKLPDAFQLASALASGAEFLITNDQDFRTVTDLNVVLLAEIV